MAHVARHAPLPFAALLGVLILLGGAGVPDAAAGDAFQPSPVLVVRQLDGAQFDLAALKGKVVVVNVWATWCPPCRAEMPMLDAFYRQHRAAGVVMLGLSADDPHDRRDVKQAMQGLSYPAALLRDATANGFGAPKVLPITYVIGPDGTIHATLLPQHGALTEPELRDAVLPLLATVAEAAAAASR